MTFESLLNDNCYIGTHTSSQNTLGEWLDSWTYSTTKTKCRFQPYTEGITMGYAGEFVNLQDRIFLLSSSSITKYDRILYNSDYFRIRDLRFDSSKHHLVASLSGLP